MSLLRILLRIVVTLLLLPLLAGAALWLLGPALLAPHPDFDQGPGGALAYVSIANQLRAQTTALAQGEPVRVVLTESEFSGLIASAILSGQRFSQLAPNGRCWRMVGSGWRR